MIVEFIGQPASGKSFISKETEQYLKSKNIQVFAPELELLKRPRIKRIITISIWIFFHLGFIFNKGIRSAINIIKHEMKGRKKNQFLYHFYFSLYLIRSSKCNQKNSIILFSESIINLTGYVLKKNLEEAKVKIFADIYKKEFKSDNLQILYIYVTNDLDLILKKKAERYNYITKEELAYNEKDIKINIHTFNQLMSLDIIKNHVIRFHNNYDEETSWKIKHLSEQIIDKFNSPS